MAKHRLSRRELHRAIEKKGEHPLAVAHGSLDEAVRKAYGIRNGADVLTLLARLNRECAEKEARIEPIRGPGLPSDVKQRNGLISTDFVHMA
jgi:hypothetical protein